MGKPPPSSLSLTPEYGNDPLSMYEGINTMFICLIMSTEACTGAAGGRDVTISICSTPGQTPQHETGATGRAERAL